MELVGDDGMLNQEIEGNDLEGVLVGGFQDDGAGCPRLLDLEPTSGADTPPVARLEAGEPVLGVWSGKVVSEGLGGLEEGFVDDAAYRVDPEVVLAGLAAAGAVKTGHGFASADLKGLA